MKIATLSGILLLALFPGYGQYCVSGGPSSTIDSNVESVSITGTSGAINWTGCPGVTGVQVITSQTATLSRGNSFTLDVQFGTCGNYYPGAGQVWIDYNQNFVFDASESVGTWSGTPPASLSSFNFTVPVNATLGQTRMRVMQFEGGSLPLDPCSSMNWGSVTDFTLTIAEGVDCSSYTGDDMADAIVVSTLPYTDNHANSVCYSNQNPTYPSPDVFYKVIIDPSNPYLKASLCGSSFDTFITAMEANGTVIIANDDATTCAPQSEILFNTTGMSSVYIVVEGWGALTGDYTLAINDDVLGLEEAHAETLYIRPNPASTSVFLNNSSEGEIILTDMGGKVVLSSHIAPYAEIDVQALKPGTYLMHYTDHSSTFIQKFIKQ